MKPCYYLFFDHITGRRVFLMKSGAWKDCLKIEKWNAVKRYFEGEHACRKADELNSRPGYEQVWVIRL